MEPVEKVYPSIEELGNVNKKECPECSALFNSDSNLKLHLVKTHKKSKLLEPVNTNKIFYCPITTCSYNNTSHFKQLKPLKQHFLKVHSDKNFVCKLCQKGFATESSRDRHTEYCDVIFKCCDCDMFYSCYETLKTHSRRKKHDILEKVAYKTSVTPTVKNPKSDNSLVSNKFKLILLKPSNSTGMINTSDTSEQSVQTDKSNNSQETQTFLATRMPQFTVETQTIGDYFTKRPDNLNTNLKSIKTQTITPVPKTSSCNTSFLLDDFVLNVMDDVQRSSSSTQTNICEESDEDIYSASTSTHDSIHTDTSDLLKDTFDLNYFNMETQTDFDELFNYCDDYSNMYTQTCQELWLGEIGLNDTHTQTVIDDVLKSVESQTVMSQFKIPPTSCKDNVTHMETQTDMHFKQMLEEINA
ncbi:ATM interactor [Tribolium madens]|uniref:ATM interactor n=1 Tax=Tribolium madens TaxID=41895 RepID=UPI001CF72D57|nr:ATM interactor [Tribolium madens]